jgi:hypothetical protein
VLYILIHAHLSVPKALLQNAEAVFLSVCALYANFLNH